MKLLVLLLILFSCGKHTMPSEQDLGDSDGDLIVNRDESKEMEKYIAKTISVEKIEVEMEFISKSSGLKKSAIKLINQIDLKKQGKDLLVKNLKSIRKDQHFLEISSLVFNEAKTIELPKGETFDINLNFLRTKSVPQKVYLEKDGHRTFIGKWKPQMEFELTQGQLKEILNGESHFSLSFFEETEKSIEEKTNRVLINDGKNVKVHYVSKELPVIETLKIFEINSYRFIDEQNLLTTSMNDSGPLWWVRVFDQNIVIIKEELNNLSEHYLNGFEKKSYHLSRVNGKAGAPLTIRKQSFARTLLKIDGQKTHITFKDKTEVYNQGGGGTNGSVEKCTSHLRIPIEEKRLPLTFDFLQSQMNLSSAALMNEIVTESTLFWELEVPAQVEHFSLSLNHLAQNEYLVTGRYESNCEKKNIILRTPEGRLDLFIDVFIEKID